MVNDKYSTLRILYSLVKGTRFPTQFACTPTEIITHHHLPWDTILLHLTELQTEGLVERSTPTVITLTNEGLMKIQADKAVVE